MFSALRYRSALKVTTPFLGPATVPPAALVVIVQTALKPSRFLVEVGPIRQGAPRHAQPALQDISARPLLV